MKRFLFLLLLAGVHQFLQAQYVYTIKADSVKITNSCDTAELIIENHSQNISGFLFNKGRGRTEFRRAVIKINDSTYLIGADTIKALSNSAAWLTAGNSGMNAAINFLGTVDSVDLVFKTYNTERARMLSRNGNFGLNGITAPTAKLHIGAGSATAGTAPIKLTSGPLLTTAETGAIEFLTDRAYLGITSGAARKELALWDFPSAVTQVAYTTTNGRLASSAKMVYDDTYMNLNFTDNAYRSHSVFSGTPNYDVNYGLKLWNTGAATSTVPAMSPGINFRGQAWSTANARSESVEFGQWIDTKNGTQAGGNLSVQARINSPYSNLFYQRKFSVNSDGGVIIHDKITNDMMYPIIRWMDEDLSVEWGRIDFRNSNVLVGQSAGPSGTTLSPSGNIAIGNFAGGNLTSGNSNIVIGNGVYAPSASGSRRLNIGNVIFGTNMYDNSSGQNANVVTNANIGISVASPTARLHLPAGTATAGTAPLKLNQGTLLTTPENGAIEYDGTNYSASVGTIRYTLAKTLSGTSALDFPSTAAQSSADLTITITGAATGDPVSVGTAIASVMGNTNFSAWVSAADTVTVRFNNYSSGAVDPPSGTFRVSVIKY